jgi:CDP-diacylglycerol--serine O-phosphatidyltransferase
MSIEKPSVNRTNRGIYLLPNLFTMAALFAGFYAIISATKQHFEAASIAIFIAMLLDALDGRVARLTHTQTKFGAEFDSLSDMVSFGLSPALVLYYWSLSHMGKAGWLVAFLYTVCTALRLARFNSRDQNEEKRYFQGLSTTAAAGFIAGFIWSASYHGFDHTTRGMCIATFVMTIIVALLKVSFLRYRSFKDFDMRGRVPFVGILILVLLLVLVSYDPPDVLFAVFALYTISGPIGWLMGLLRKK